VRRASLPRRLERLTEQRGSLALERTVREVAAEYGLHPVEVRAEFEEIAERVRRFGPCSADEVVTRCAAEFGLSEDDLRAELAGAPGAAGHSVGSAQ